VKRKENEKTQKKGKKSSPSVSTWRTWLFVECCILALAEDDTSSIVATQMMLSHWSKFHNWIPLSLSLPSLSDKDKLPYAASHLPLSPSLPPAAKATTWTTDLGGGTASRPCSDTTSLSLSLSLPTSWRQWQARRLPSRCRRRPPMPPVLALLGQERPPVVAVVRALPTLSKRGHQQHCGRPT
jgi:hypothetical protein